MSITIPSRFQAGTILSAGYIAVILWLRWPFSLQTLRDMPLNAFGDALAGFAGPLAFLWLVIGYLQQGEELRQNALAIRLQTDELQQNGHALHLQAEELKNAVDQHKEMVKATRESIEFSKEVHRAREESERENSKPLFSAGKVDTIRTTGSMGVISLPFRLVSGSAQNVKIVPVKLPTGAKSNVPPGRMEVGDAFTLTWPKPTTGTPYRIEFHAEYRSPDGLKFQQIFSLVTDKVGGISTITEKRTDVG